MWRVDVSKITWDNKKERLITWNNKKTKAAHEDKRTHSTLPYQLAKVKTVSKVSFQPGGGGGGRGVLDIS